MFKGVLLQTKGKLWKWQYMSITLSLVILILSGQSCLMFVYFENPREVNTPCSPRFRQTTGVWYQTELKLCQHIQSLTLPPPDPNPNSQFVSVANYTVHPLTYTTIYYTKHFAVSHLFSVLVFKCSFLFIKIKTIKITNLFLISAKDKLIFHIVCFISFFTFM